MQNPHFTMYWQGQGYRQCDVTDQMNELIFGGIEAKVLLAQKEKEIVDLRQQLRQAHESNHSEVAKLQKLADDLIREQQAGYLDQRRLVQFRQLEADLKKGGPKRLSRRRFLELMSDCQRVAYHSRRFVGGESMVGAAFNCNEGEIDFSSIVDAVEVVQPNDEEANLDLVFEEPADEPSDSGPRRYGRRY